MQVLHNVNRILYEIVKKVIIALLILMSTFVFAQVICRYVLKQPLVWSEELTTYMFSWLAYIGAAAVTYRNDHVAITTLVDGIRNKTIQKLIRIATQIIIFVFYVMVCYLSFHLAGRFIAIDQRLTNLDFIKTGYVFMQVPLSALLMGMFTLERIFRLWRDEDPDLEMITVTNTDSVETVSAATAADEEGGEI